MKVDKISTSKPSVSKGINFNSTGSRQTLRFDDDLLNAVFSGGYYIMLMDDEEHPLRSFSVASIPTRSRKKRTAKGEEALELANLTLQIIENVKQIGSGPPEEIDTKKGISHHERLLDDLQHLISKSNLVLSDHQQHLKEELDIARQQLLRGGAIDDYALMKTLQEIAGVQGLSIVGSAMGGKFAGDIIDPPEPPKYEESYPITHQQSLEPSPDCNQFGSFQNDVEEFLQLHYNQFSAYDISEVGGCKHKKSHFFAKKIMDYLVNTAPAEKEQNTAEITV